MDLPNKKLLILGGVQLACSVVKLAQQKGIQTIVVDYNEDSPAKRIADKSYLISTTDIEAIVDLCKKENVDGIFTSYIESMLPYCCMICERLNLPFYATLEQIQITSNKKKFKELCRVHNIPTIKEFHINDVREQKDLYNLDYPVFTKPVDNSGARGMSVCRNVEELKSGYLKALEFSKSRSVLIEKYMDESCQCVNIDYLIIDGVFYLVGVGDKAVYRTRESPTPITASVTYPSKFLEEYLSDLNEKVIKMFQSIGIRNGYIFIESFHDKEGFHFYEMGFRIGGGQYYIMNSQITHINFMELLIEYSLTGQMQLSAKERLCLSPYLSKKCCGLVILLSSGKITAIEGISEVLALQYVVDFTQLLSVGDNLEQSDMGTLKQAFARVYIVAESDKDLADTIIQIYSRLKVYDLDGKELIIRETT